jgi:ubiquinone/menaquinone biosynthesis C-methylase UbiE
MTVTESSAGGYDVAAGYYDPFAAQRGPSALPSVGFFTGLMPEGGRVLDVGAGTGRITNSGG